MSRVYVRTILLITSFLICGTVHSAQKYEPAPFQTSKDSATFSFLKKVSDFDDAFKTILQRPEMLNKNGQIIKNLNGADLQNVQKLFQEKLSIQISLDDTKLFCDRMIQDARVSGVNWQKKTSISNLFRPSRSSHGYLAEALNFDDLKKEFPSLDVRFTASNSISADLVVMKEYPSGKTMPIMGVQTKVKVDALDSLRSGLDDAQTFYANKLSHGDFRISIPKDHFEDLVNKKILSQNGEIIKPEDFLKKLNKNIETAFADGDSQKGANNYRLKQIPENHQCDCKTFNNKVIEKTRVKSLDKTYKEIIKLEDNYHHIRSEILNKSAYVAYKNAMPENFKVSKNSALVASALVATGIFVQNGISFDTAEEAFSEAKNVAVKSFVSTYTANGIMRKIDNKILLTTILDSTRMSEKQLAALSATLNTEEKYLFAKHMAGTTFLATFIFDESGTILSLINGQVSDEQFLIETGKNIFVASTVGAVTWGSIVLGASPTGMVVAAVAIGTQYLVTKIVKDIQLYRDKQYISLNDFVGKLPLEIKNRITVFDAEISLGLVDISNEKGSKSFPEVQPQSFSFYDILIHKRSVFEP